MESNNDNYKQGPEQLRKRKFNELDNDGQPTAAGGEGQQHQPPENLSKKKYGGLQGNDDFENLHLESLTQEDLIKLVRKQLANQNEVHHKQLEVVKKEAEESITTKMEDMKMALLASQQKVERLTAEMANQRNVEHRKHLDGAKQAEEFSQRIVYLEQEKVQLNESTREQHRIRLPTEQQMKLQLSLETWYDWLAFVPRHQLGQIVPKIGDRRFASIIQKFLHLNREIMINCIEIVAPYEEDPSGPHPRVRARQNNRPLRFEMAEAPMPTNIKNFKCLELRYFDTSVLNFMQKFQQNGLLDNVNLSFEKLSKDIIQPVLCHILPLISGIASIGLRDSAQLVDIYDAGNNKEIYELNKKMMEKTRLLAVSYERKNLRTNMIDLYCRWLYQMARADGKPRVLLIGRTDVDSTPISLFIDRIKQDFLMATDSATFLIRIDLPKAFKPQENICLINDKTREGLMTKMEEADLEKWETFVLLISRHLLASTNKWIVGKEYYEKRIYLYNELEVVSI